jgi:apolipoprotein N-acyltransferase
LEHFRFGFRVCFELRIAALAFGVSLRSASIFGFIRRVKRFFYRWLLPVASGVLLALAFPPFNIAECAWVALVPLLFAIEKCSGRAAFRSGYVAGLVFYGMTVWWTIHVTVFGTAAFVAALAVYFGLSVALFPLLRRGNSVVANFSFIIAGTAWWVMLEWVRGKIIFGGFGWNGLGVSQHQTLPLIQMAEVTGVYGVSALVCAANLAIYVTVRRLFTQPMERRLSWELYALVVLLCSVFIHGVKLVRGERGSARGLRVAMIQADIPQSLKFDPREKPMILERYRQWSEKAAVLKPDLMIWPETATPGPLRYDDQSYGLATSIAARANAPLLTGTMDITPPNDWFNAAALVMPDGRVTGMYHKIHLVVFGEYVPLRKIFPFIKWFTPIDGSFERGTTHDIFQFNDVRFGAVICFEDTLPDLYRRFAMRGVNFMVDLTNDAWFKDSPASEQHLANARFRAVETRCPLVRCSNNGVTCVIDEFGQVNPLRRLPVRQEGMLVCEVPLAEGRAPTFYMKHGDWFIGVCALVSALATGWTVWKIRHLPG